MVKRIWNQYIPLTINLFSLNRGNWNPMEYWTWMMKNLKEEELEQAILILWSLWSYRNTIAQRSSKPDKISMIRAVERSLELREADENSYLNIQQRGNRPKLKTLMSHGRWTPPPTNTWKLNTDASWSDKQQRGGIGWILRDSSGSSINLGFRRISRKWSIKFLELKAIVEGLKNIPQVYFGNGDQISTPIFVESDALNIIKLINEEDEDISEISFLTEEIRRLKNLFVEIHFVFCPRALNAAADRLARAAISPPLNSVLDTSSTVEEGAGVWNGLPPVWVRNLLNEVDVTNFSYY